MLFSAEPVVVYHCFHYTTFLGTKLKKKSSPKDTFIDLRERKEGRKEERPRGREREKTPIGYPLHTP